MMASYQSGFDPPNWPQDPSRNRSLGTYQKKTGVGRYDSREAEITRRAGRIMAGPAPPTGLPRPSGLSSSPSVRSVSEAKLSGIMGSRFGLGNASSTPVPTDQIPVGKSTSSRNVLRRKPSSIAQRSVDPKSKPERAGSISPSRWQQVPAVRRPSIEASLKSAEAYHDIFARNGPARSTRAESPQIIPELDRYRTQPDENAGLKPRIMHELPHKLSTQDLPPPTPLLSGTPMHSGSSSSHHRYSIYSASGYSASPSTRFSESPGLGAYSRDTTPTSMSSQSPGIVAPMNSSTPRSMQGSPAQFRPPITRRRAGSTPKEVEVPILDPHGLPSLQESFTSSSSNSTLKGGTIAKEKKEKKKGILAKAPNPPPRKSSQKFKKTGATADESPSKPSKVPAAPVMASPSKMSPSLSQSATSPVHSKSTPPTRPSRDGAPDLQSQMGDSMAVIQSNLSGLSFSPDWSQSHSPLSRSATTSPPRAPFTSGSQPASRLPSRNPSPNPMSTSHRQEVPAPSGLGIIPDLRPQPASSSKSSLRTPSPNVSQSRPRFALFGRRAKTTPEIPTVDPKRRATLKKGPTAGTGHEGYGRYAVGGRSQSAGGTNSQYRDRSGSAASSSMDSVSSTRTHDPFLLERMSPVIISGGGVIENRNTSLELTRSESNTSLPLSRPSVDSKVSSKSSLSHEVSRATLWPSAFPNEPQPKRASTTTGLKNRRPSDSSDDGRVGRPSAFRRSMARSNTSTSALRLPRSLNAPSIGAGSSMTSLDTSVMSDESQLEINVHSSRGRNEQAAKSKKQEKRPKSPRKWNFFHRQPKVEPKVEAPVSVTVGRPPVKPIPHYALLDSSDEQLDSMESMEMEDILRDADVVDLTNEELDMLQFGESREELRRNKENEARALAETIRETAAPVLCSSPEPLEAPIEVTAPEPPITRVEAPPRPSRLPQVGRIPKVVSARPQATSPKSFSRPFARLSISQPNFDSAFLDKDSIALGPSPPKSSTPDLPKIDLEAQTEANLPTSSTASRSENIVGSHRDFFAFSPRKTSEATTSSSGTTSFADTTAVIPDADAELAEDEVWDEYDDLIGNEVVPVSATSSHGSPFQYESYESRKTRLSKAQAKESWIVKGIPKFIDPTGGNIPHRSILTSSSVYSQEMSPRLKDALANLPTPSTPMSFTDFFSGYGDRNNSVHEDSMKKPHRGSQSSSRKSTSSNHSRAPSGLVTIDEQESSSPISQVNLRVGSMTVSKWLTFGQVLFSPAREAVLSTDNQSKCHSILVIDGLGNDDWSFYAAETYPNATFYNLSPTAPVSASHRLSTSPAFPLSPPNHRQIQYLSPAQKFPFPSSNFKVVVFRFPAAMPESSYRNIISESKRVLKPGGYLEMAVLDLDMVNMGPRARRAVRGLKMRMQDSERGVNLSSASDLCWRHIGKRGFTDAKSCNVGVPVATPIPSSPSSSSLPRSKAKVRDDRSLADMMRDESKEGDESITKMVAKVGRWWYSRCYEKGDATASIYNDAAVLRECEEWNASLKLVVCYAQKPLQGRRRTLSV